MAGKQTAVLVAGSWGSALAGVLADNGHRVLLWTRNAEQAEEINRSGNNTRYLPGIRLPERIRATTSMAEALSEAEAVILAAPSSAMREIAAMAAKHIRNDALLLHATKGFEADSLKRMTEVIGEEMPGFRSRIVVLSGPSHAEEVIRRCPTTVVVASESADAAEAAQDLLINSYFRVYTNPDVVGVELGGALKNIIALGAGLSDGLGFGDNAKAALLTRGLVEIARLGTAMGGHPLTFAGLSGVGDLVVTCTSKHSRNWRAGYLLGQGRTLEEVLRETGMVVEGVRTTKAAYALASRYGVEMPITVQLYEVLFDAKPPKLAVEMLMGRDRTHEMEDIVREIRGGGME
jgi:glycerol-3-phosphate dehydrogenase (NAD(P)+)